MNREDVPELLAATDAMRMTVKLKQAALTENCIKGAASVMGNLMSNRTVIFPGFFSQSIKAFLKDGFVAIGHDWASLPCAMPVLAEERGRELYSEATFHSTEAGKEARIVCVERLAQGLSVGLSVGFLPDYTLGDDGEYAGVRYFENGKALLAFAESLRCDMSLFDTRAIRACKDFCRGLLPGGCQELFEYSIVTVPMNRKARATEAYSDTQIDLPDSPGANAANQITNAAIDVLTDFDPASVATERQFEEFLRDAGFSRKAATAIALHGFASYRTSLTSLTSLQRDADADDIQTETENDADIQADSEDAASDAARETPAAAGEALEQSPRRDLHALRMRERILHEWQLTRA